MSDNKLVIHPSDPEASIPSVEDLRATLAGLGLISEPFDYYGLRHYRPGTRFLDLVSFEHSHSAIELVHRSGGLRASRVSDSRTLCSLEITHTDSELQFLGAANTESPSCSRCAYVCEEWSALVSAWYDTPDSYVWSCPECSAAWRPWQLDWHLTCGFGRCSVAVWHVHHGEAHPSQELLAALQRLGAGSWRYFFYNL